MVYSGIIVTEPQIALMAGENADATGDTEANHNILAAQAEAYLSNLVKYDIASNWAALSTVYRQMFSEWAARYAGMTLIAYNMITWATNTSIIEAEDLIQTHIYRMEAIEKILKDSSIQDFMGVQS
jgi:hypothetical protein